MSYDAIQLRSHASAQAEPPATESPPTDTSGYFTEITTTAGACAAGAVSLYLIILLQLKIGGGIAIFLSLILIYPMLWLLLAPPAIAFRSRKRLGFTFLAPLLVAGISLIGVCPLSIIMGNATTRKSLSWLGLVIFFAIMFGASGGIQGYLVAVKNRAIKLGILTGALAGSLTGIAVSSLTRHVGYDLDFVQFVTHPATISPISALIFLMWLVTWVVLEIDRTTNRLKYGSGLLPRKLRPLLPEIPRLTLAADSKKSAPHPFRREDRHEKDIAWRQAWMMLGNRSPEPLMIIALSGSMHPPHAGEFWDLIVEAIRDGWRYFLVAGKRLDAFIISRDARLTLEEIRTVNGVLAICETADPPEIQPEIDDTLTDRILAYKSAIQSVQKIRDKIQTDARDDGDPDSAARDDSPSPNAAKPPKPADPLDAVPAPLHFFYQTHDIIRSKFGGGTGGWSANSLHTPSGVSYLLLKPYGRFEPHILKPWKKMLADNGRAGHRIIVVDLRRLIKITGSLAETKFLNTLTQHNGVMIFANTQSNRLGNLVESDDLDKVVSCTDRNHVLRFIDAFVQETIREMEESADGTMGTADADDADTADGDGGHSENDTAVGDSGDNADPDGGHINDEAT